MCTLSIQIKYLLTGKVIFHMFQNFTNDYFNFQNFPNSYCLLKLKNKRKMLTLSLRNCNQIPGQTEDLIQYFYS